MRMLLRFLLIVLIVQFHVIAQEPEMPMNFTAMKKIASQAALWKVLIKDDAKDAKYQIEDPAVIQRLSELMDLESEFIESDVGISLSPHIYVDFVLDKEGKSVVRVEVTGDCLWLLRKGKRYLAVLKSEDLYNRLADKDFEFPAKAKPNENHDGATPNTGKDLERGINMHPPKRQRLNLQPSDRRAIPSLDPPHREIPAAIPPQREQKPEAPNQVRRKPPSLPATSIPVIDASNDS